MPRLPKKLQENSAYATEWNAMVDYLASLRPMHAPNTLTQHTPYGVFRRANAQGIPGKGGGLNFRGAYSSSESYDIDDVVYTGSDKQRIDWVCLISNSPTDIHYPTWPEPVDPDPVYWRCLSISPPTLRGTITNGCYPASGGADWKLDYFQVTFPSGEVDLVAKGFDCRPSTTSKSFIGTGVNYTYSSSNLRYSTAPTGVGQYEVLIPPIQNGDQIFIGYSANGAGVVGASCFFFDMTPRIWGRRNIQ